MNQRHLALLALASASVCAVVFTACGGDDNNNGDSGGGDATTSDVVSNDSPQSNDTGADTGGNDGGSNDGTTVDTGCAPGPNCQACCIQKYPDAAAGVVANEVACACTNPGLCNTNQTCKNNLCNQQAASTNCTACLDDKDAGDCRAKAGAACIQDPSCQPLAQCVIGCAGGPTDAGGGG
jgi:hypothetical protein